jgi:hypothetical protein
MQEQSSLLIEVTYQMKCELALNQVLELMQSNLLKFKINLLLPILNMNKSNFIFNFADSILNIFVNYLPANVRGFCFLFSPSSAILN